MEYLLLAILRIVADCNIENSVMMMMMMMMIMLIITFHNNADYLFLVILDLMTRQYSRGARLC